MKKCHILACCFLFVILSCNKSDECPYGRQKIKTTQTASSYFTGNKNSVSYMPFSFIFASKNGPNGDALIIVGDYDECGVSDYVFLMSFTEFSTGPKLIKRASFQYHYGDPTDPDYSTAIDSLDSRYPNVITFDSVYDNGTVVGTLQMRLLIPKLYYNVIRSKDTMVHLENIRFRGIID